MFEYNIRNLDRIFVYSKKLNIRIFDYDPIFEYSNIRIFRIFNYSNIRTSNIRIFESSNLRIFEKFNSNRRIFDIPSIDTYECIYLENKFIFNFLVKKSGFRRKLVLSPKRKVLLQIEPQKSIREIRKHRYIHLSCIYLEKLFFSSF